MVRKPPQTSLANQFEALWHDPEAGGSHTPLSGPDLLALATIPVETPILHGSAKKSDDSEPVLQEIPPGEKMRKVDFDDADSEDVEVIEAEENPSKHRNRTAEREAPLASPEPTVPTNKEDSFGLWSKDSEGKTGSGSDTGKVQFCDPSLQICDSPVLGKANRTRQSGSGSETERLQICTSQTCRNPDLDPAHRASVEADSTPDIEKTLEDLAVSLQTKISARSKQPEAQRSHRMELRGRSAPPKTDLHEKAKKAVEQGQAPSAFTFDPGNTRHLKAMKIAATQNWADAMLDMEEDPPDTEDFAQ